MSEAYYFEDIPLFLRFINFDRVSPLSKNESYAQSSKKVLNLTNNILTPTHPHIHNP